MSTRQLAAIMFTDIVGYTALMGKDSNKALELVRISKEIQKPLVEKHHGQWLKEMGDGALVKFGTALDAVSCAIDIQKAARAEFDGKLRIGIHSGDITIEDDDVYGDGVNVASRLESLADPGGIYISDAIEKAIRGQSEVQAKYLGESKLKNVDYGVRTYAVQGVGLPVPEVKEAKELSGHIWAEVQRRGMIRAAVAYLVAGLVLVLLLRETQNWITLPDWSLTAVLAGLLVGFPIAMYLAWNYERSPEGFVRTSSPESWQNPYSTAKRKPLTGSFVIAGLVLVIAFVYFYPSFRFVGQESETLESVMDSRVIDKSIVVLPFADMSINKDQEYFSDGMMEEILNHLVKIKDLKVISRTTAMQYKGTTKTVHEITQELKVATALEGSVRKDGDQLRITVQLIEGDTDMHLWSESYDRQLTNIFEVQSDVAQQIAQVLQAEINPAVKLRIEASPTSNPEAYNLYLQAQAQYKARNSKKAIALLEEATAIDPEFASAYAQIGAIKSNVYDLQIHSNVNTTEEALQVARYYYGIALKIDPNNLKAHSHKARMHLWLEWDFVAADREYQIEKQLDPYASFGGLLLYSGRFKEATRSAEHKLEVDPLSPYDWGHKILAHHYMNQMERAFETFNEAVSLYEVMIDNSGLDYLSQAISEVYLDQGMNEEALRSIEKYLSENKDPRTKRMKAVALFHLGEIDKTTEIIEEIKINYESSVRGSPAYELAMIYAQMGEINSAFLWLDHAYQHREQNMFRLKVEQPFEPLYGDPRWQQMLDKVGFPE